MNSHESNYICTSSIFMQNMDKIKCDDSYIREMKSPEHHSQQALC